MHNLPINLFHGILHSPSWFGESDDSSVNEGRPVLLNRMLWVAENGDDETAVRNHVNRPFRSIEAALENSQDGDCLVICPGAYGGGEIRSRLTLFFLPESEATQSLQVKAAGVQIKAWGAKIGGVNSDLAKSYSIEGGTVTDTLEAYASTIQLKGVKVKTASVELDRATLVAHNCELEKVLSIRSGSCQLFYCKVSSKTQGIDFSAGNSILQARHCTIIGESAEAIVVNGAMDLSHCYIQSKRASPIKFIQGVRGRNNLSHSQIIGKGRHCIDFSSDRRYPPLFIDSNSMNLPIPPSAYIEEGINVINDAVEHQEYQNMPM